MVQTLAHISAFSRRRSILSEGAFSQASLTPVQSSVDGLVSRFVEEASSPTTLGALMAGGMAYRVGRVGVMGLRVGAYSCTPLRVASIAVGLGSEVTAYEFTNRSLRTLRAHGRAPVQDNPNLWSWSGPGGWQQGLLSSTITFGVLKGAGSLAREQNIFFQHAFQSTAMVAGHNATAIFSLTPRPEGSIAEQLLHAEATNLQLGAGTSLVHHLAPGLHAWERGLDVSLSVRSSGSLGGLAGESLSPEWVRAGSQGRSGGVRPARNPWTMQMSSNDSSGNGEGPSSAPPSRRREYGYVSLDLHLSRALGLAKRLDENTVARILEQEGQNITRPLETAIQNPRVRGRLLAEVVNKGFREKPIGDALKTWLRVHHWIVRAYENLDFETVDAYLENVNEHFGLNYQGLMSRMREVRSTVLNFDDLSLNQPGRYIIPRNDYLRDVFLRQTPAFDRGAKMDSDRLLRDPEQLGLTFAGTFRNDIGSLLLIESAVRRVVPGVNFVDFLRLDPDQISPMAARYRRMVIGILRGSAEYRRILLEGSGDFHRTFLRAALNHPRFGIRQVYPQIYEFTESIPDSLARRLRIEKLPPLEEVDAKLGVTIPPPPPEE